jgi:hypothetical protein
VILVADGSYALRLLLLNTLIFLSCSLCARSRIQDVRCIYISFRRDFLFIASESVFLQFFRFLPKNAEITYLHCQRQSTVSFLVLYGCVEHSDHRNVTRNQDHRSRGEGDGNSFERFRLCMKERDSKNGKSPSLSSWEGVNLQKFATFVLNFSRHLSNFACVSFKTTFTLNDRDSSNGSSS